jgi:hypothetical protein
MKEEQVVLIRKAVEKERVALELQMELNRLSNRIVKPIMATGRQAKGRRKGSIVSTISDPEKAGNLIRVDQGEGEPAGDFWAMLKENFLYLFANPHDNMPLLTISLENSRCEVAAQRAFTILLPSDRRHLFQLDTGTVDPRTGAVAEVEGWIDAIRGSRSRSLSPLRGMSPSDKKELAPPTWVPDVDVAECYSCGVGFSFFKPKHHCRSCGRVYCHTCCSHRMELPVFGYDEMVRVCNACVPPTEEASNSAAARGEHHIEPAPPDQYPLSRISSECQSPTTTRRPQIQREAR